MNINAIANALRLLADAIEDRGASPDAAHEPMGEVVAVPHVGHVEQAQPQPQPQTQSAPELSLEEFNGEMIGIAKVIGSAELTQLLPPLFQRFCPPGGQTFSAVIPAQRAAALEYLRVQAKPLLDAAAARAGGA